MTTRTTLPTLAPLLIVRDAARAVAVYVEALGARETARYVNKHTGAISHVDLAVGEARFSLTEEAAAWNSLAPPSLGGSPVVLQLHVADVDAVFEAMCAAGGTAVFAVQEFCGERMGRVRDPFGHLWIVAQRVEELSAPEIQRRRDEWAPAGAASKQGRG